MDGSSGAETAVGPKPQHSLQDLKHAAQTLWQETQASIADSRQRFQAYNEKAQSCKQVTSMLKGLPKRPSHDIMLPLGKAALLPARLVNTERCSMSLGHGVQIECSREKAMATLEQQLQDLIKAMQATEEDLKALDRKLSIAENTLEATLEEEGGLVDIREEQDHALLSQSAPADASTSPSRSDAVFSAASSEAVEIGANAAADTGGGTGRRRSVTFAEAPAVRAFEDAAQPKSPGLRKGFLGKPKPALRKTSSITDDSSSVSKIQKAPEHVDASGSTSRYREQLQSDLDEGRDAAFSGQVVERPISIQTGATAEHVIDIAPVRHAVSERNAEGSEQSARKVSRFKQQRQAPH